MSVDLIKITSTTEEIMSVNAMDLVCAAIDTVNSQADNGPKIEKSPDTPLLGESDGLDSLVFVHFVVAIEEQIQSQTGQSIVLINESTLTSETSPFRTVSTLAAYLDSILN